MTREEKITKARDILVDTLGAEKLFWEASMFFGPDKMERFYANVLIDHEIENDLDLYAGTEYEN